MSPAEHLHGGDGIALDAIADILSRLDDEEFAARYGALMLLVADDDRAPTGGRPGTREVPDRPDAGTGASRFRVFPVRKGAANQMRHITIGRTRNNDVWIDDATLSKFHAFLMEDDEALRVLDGGSANFTRLNGELVPVRGAGDPPPIQPGDALRLGGLETTLVDVPGLRAFLRGLAELGS